MSITSEIEEKFNIDIDTLNTIEKATYFKMLEEVQKAQMTPEKLRNHIIEMRNAVEQELVKVDLEHKQDVFLKARLKNYMLLESFLISPERAKESLENMISGMANNKG
jgi:7-cyano-7-deazaguanine synthase in queuosine biosynthesis